MEEKLNENKKEFDNYVYVWYYHDLTDEEIENISKSIYEKDFESFKKWYNKVVERLDGDTSNFEDYISCYNDDGDDEDDEFVDIPVMVKENFEKITMQDPEWG